MSFTQIKTYHNVPKFWLLFCTIWVYPCLFH